MPDSAGFSQWWYAALPVATSIFLIRHAAHAELGQCLTGRKEGVRLSEEGERQARCLGKRLAGEALSAIHTSPRLRARATADAIARHAGAPVQVAGALDEIDFGDWTGIRFEHLAEQPLWRRWNEARASACPPNGEPMAAAVARIADHLQRLAEFDPGARVALVSHCDMIRGVIAHYIGLPLDHMLRFDIDCASISVLQLGASGAQVTRLNERIA